MKTRHRNKTLAKRMIHAIVLILWVGIAAGCQNDSNTIALSHECVKGKYLGRYCEGFVIQILDDSKIGRDWDSMHDSATYSNSVVASVDSLLLNSLSSGQSAHYFSEGSVFFFQYKEGGYPRRQYNICEPSPFITISFLSKEACVDNESK